ncbi:SixA phosphatase family protein [Algihabitans albus]|uniref:SixA phosphatase family protein n=1 Tax=Algihabitans albus TaxID=2164067 RepID=UPI000E5C8097|nr:histidine phosphatase family protein [Algihabitans albus]
MKTLLLYRHAKSAWDDTRLDDFDRPLSPRGRKAAPRIGAEIAARDLLPELVICSAAVRTQETWRLTAAKLGGSSDLRILRSLYLASPAQILRQVHRTPDTIDRLMVIAHNPGLETLSLCLAGPGSAAGDRDRLAEKFPTAGLAVFALDQSNWPDLQAGSARLTAFLRPRDLE